MTLTVRSATVTGATTKGSALTHAEMDANWAHVIDSSNSSYTASGSGATATTVQAELRRWIRPEHYGAAADGTTNDRTALSNADTAATSSGTILFQAGKTYLCSTSLTITAACYFEPGARISVPVGQTITFSGRVITLGGSPTTGSGSASFGHEGNVFINAASGSGGFGFGSHVPSGADDFFHIRRDVNTSVGILVKNQHTGSAAETFLHLFSDTGDTGAGVRISANSIAGGALADIVFQQNSGASIIQASNVALDFYTNNLKAFSILPTSTTVNYGTVKGGASGSSPIWSVAGSDSNLSFIVDAIGTGGFIARTDAGTITAFEVVRAASATRWVRVTPSNGGNPTISVSGGELSVGTNAWTFGIANSVSPTSPNRTLTVTIGATTYYIHAKTTND